MAEQVLHPSNIDPTPHHVGRAFRAQIARFDVLVMATRNRRESVKKSGPKRWESADELFEGVVAEWSKRQVPDKKSARVTIRAARPKIELQEGMVFRDGNTIPLGIQRGTQRLNGGPPKLKEIFDAQYDAKKGWSLRFLGEPPEKAHDAKGRRFWASDDLKPLEHELHDDELSWNKPLRNARTFFELLWLTIVASHDHGASILLDKLGYLYVNSLLWQSGLFDAARGGGMWIARNYGGGDTKDTKSQYIPNEQEFWDMSGIKRPGLLVPVTRKTPDMKIRDGVVIAASLSAASGTAYMVLLEQNRLVNAPACLRMKVLLDRLVDPPRDPGYPDEYIDRSPFGDAMLTHSGDSYSTVFKHIYSKIGLGSARPGSTQNTSDCALFVTKKGVTYAATCLDSWGDTPIETLSKAIFAAVGG